jgi:hypothetical protein
VPEMTYLKIFSQAVKEFSRWTKIEGHKLNKQGPTIE